MENQINKGIGKGSFGAAQHLKELIFSNLLHLPGPGRGEKNHKTLS
jgi:hypothetical protein